MKKKNLFILLIAILTAFAFVSCDGLEIGSIVESDVVVAASTGTIADLFSSLYDGETITIPGYVTSEISYTYTDTDGNEYTDAITAGSQIDIKRGIYAFKYLEGSSEKTITALVYSSDNALDMTFGNGTGIGTSDYPYLITSTSDFLKLGNDDVQAKLKDGENHNLYFKLTSDIDLSSKSDVVGEAFSGTLDGDGHTIKCGSATSNYIFYACLEDTAFKNFTLSFNDKVVRLYEVYAVVPTVDTNGYYVYDKNTLALTFYNVDVDSADESYYLDLGDNNKSVYQSQSTAWVYSYVNGCFDQTYIGATNDTAASDIAITLWYSAPTSADSTSRGTPVDLTITYEGCDVHGKYRGGFGASGAAVFTTGQICDSDIVLKNCTFDGELIGFNVALLVANASGCESVAGTSINCENVVNNGTIKAINGQNIYYSTVTDNTKYVVPASGVTGSVEEFNPVITDTISSDASTKKISISAGTEDSATHYELRLSLSSVYWYKGGVNTRRTDSNTQVIQLETCDLTAYPAIYSDTKVISLVEAKELWSMTSDSYNWGAFESGAKYTYYLNGSTNYLVIDYDSYSDEYEYRYSKSTSPAEGDFSSTKVKEFILVGLDDKDYVTSYAYLKN